MLISSKCNIKLAVFLFLVSVVYNINPCSSEDVGTWSNNNKVLCIGSERGALLSFKKGLIDRAYRLSSWNAAAELDCCKWVGVVCNNFTGHVQELHLGFIPYDSGLQSYITGADFDADYEAYERAQLSFYADYEAYERAQLSGDINPSLQNLKHLRVLDLSYNNFNGISIPTFICSLLSLQHLNLSWAGFGGIIPSRIGNLSDLQSLGLASSDNYNFSTLKDNNLQWLSGLPLTQLQLDGVDLSGVRSWLWIMNSVSSLLELRLSGCGLYHSSSPLPRSLNFSSSLVILDISHNNLGPSVPSWIFNLHSLVSLDLGYNNFVDVIPVGLQNLTLLTSLNLEFNQFNSTIPECFQKFTHMEFLSISGNYIKGPIPSRSLSGLCHLKTIDMSSNNIGENVSDVFEGLVEGCASQSLQELILDHNQLLGHLTNKIGQLKILQKMALSSNSISGPIPESIGQLTSLKALDLSCNSISGPIPESIGQLTSLNALDLSFNSISGPIPKSIGQLTSLMGLDFSINSIFGPIPESIGQLTSLRALSLSHNQLNGSLPESLGHLSQLEILIIENNKLDGIVSGVHFIDLCNLKWLSASENSLILNVSHDWIPCFELEILDMDGWKLGPQFPLWLQLQKDLFTLILSSTGISDSIPMWFWKLSANICFVSLADNQIYGQVPNIFHNQIFGSTIDLSSNQLSGPMPILSPNVTVLDLSNNSFSGDITHFLCHRTEEYYVLEVLNLQNNNLSGDVPDCWMSLPLLMAIWLGNNIFTGQIPESMGYLTMLGSLHLENNRLNGQLPLSLQNCSQLITLDLSMNSFIGKLPKWVGQRLINIAFLTIRSNGFEGEIPKELCHLTSLRILDIAHNDFFGEIPTCFKNFTAMTFSQFSGRISYSGNSTSSLEVENIQLVIKGREDLYENSLGLASYVDLSSNNFSGKIPYELMGLLALRSLNLSRNHFKGVIPEKIGDLSLLESLDLSWNQLSGEIPPTILNLSFLSYLNLSHNNLSGKIPSGTQLESFDPFSFSGNNLCGLPLTTSCAIDNMEAPPHAISAPDNENSNENDSMWFYLGMGWGFVVGFWCVIGPIIFKKSWRVAYFRFLAHIWEKLSVVVIECTGFLA